ncbi:MAG: hypothetical protein SGPRY_004238 [Prymnesium sp.]
MGAAHLSEAELQRFIVQGYLELPPSDAPPSEHAAIASSILACGMQGPGSRVPYGLAMLDGDAAGNNLIHAAPALRGRALLESPHLIRALRSLLGPSYRLHPHCRAHLRQRGAHTTMWHVDAYKGTVWTSGRHHEPHWLMICYYPQATQAISMILLVARCRCDVEKKYIATTCPLQDTTLEMGPTELLPGSQYYRGDSDRLHYSRGHIPDFSEQVRAAEEA